MHHDHPVSAGCTLLFQIANVVIALGYAAVPFLVLRWLRLTRPALLLGAGFFIGCAGTHLWMGFGQDHPVTFWWTVWHVGQAICTWGFILWFGHDLRTARRRLEANPKIMGWIADDGGAVPGGH